MNKSEFTLKSRFRKRFLIFLLLAGFVCSLNVGVYCAAGNSDSNRRSGSLAIHTGATSVRNYALTNAPHSLTENNFTKPKPVKQRAHRLLAKFCSINSLRAAPSLRAAHRRSSPNPKTKPISQT
jgi:hypothetical protein